MGYVVEYGKLRENVTVREEVTTPQYMIQNLGTYLELILKLSRYYSLFLASLSKVHSICGHCLSKNHSWHWSIIINYHIHSGRK